MACQRRTDRCVYSVVPIGQGMRRYGLDLIREKLATTQGSAIALTVLVMNLEKLLELLFVLLAFWPQLLWALGTP